jgi:hypothetical protein
MPAGSTYTPIATTTLGSAQASVSFSSFSGYTDLVLVCNFGTSKGSQDGLLFRVNSDSGSNYSVTRVSGNGTTASSDRSTSTTSLIAGGVDGSTTTSLAIYNVMNYANTTTYKTVLMRNNYSAAVTNATVGLWRSTSAITSIQLSAESATNLRAGSTFTLYGIASA